MNRKLPVYAPALIQKRRQGLAPRRDLLIACDWDVGTAWPWRIVVTPGEDPKTIDFAVCAGLSCLLLGHDGERLAEVAQAVLRFSPMRLVGVRLGGQVIETFKAAPCTHGLIDAGPVQEAECVA
jgi:hypothetical protein